MRRKPTAACLCAACLFLLLLPALAACAVFPDPDTFEGGETVTPERLAAISAEVFTQPDPTEAPTMPDIDPADLAFEGAVFWTPGGRVWHTDSACYHLKDAETLSGSVADAVAAGKSDVCSACRKRAQSAD